MRSPESALGVSGVAGQVGVVAGLRRGGVLGVSVASRHGLPDHKDGRVVALSGCRDGREGTGGCDGGVGGFGGLGFDNNLLVKKEPNWDWQ